MLQTDVRIRTILDVSDRIADNLNVQFGFGTELVGSRYHRTKQCSQVLSRPVYFGSLFLVRTG